MVSENAWQVPFRLVRLGVVMRPADGAELEVEGVLNPASGFDADGRLWLLPRLVAEGNVSRVGSAEVVVDHGVPVGVRRHGVVLAPEEAWERSYDHAGVEDPRVTWVESLRKHVMAYVSYGPLGPRPALAVSEDLHDWRRLGPLHFAYQSGMGVDLNIFSNKDVVVFPEVVPGPDGEPSYAMLHRPMWDLRSLIGGDRVDLPTGLHDDRPGIWISYAPAQRVQDDISALVHLAEHRLVALPAYGYEAVKIGAGPPPVRVEEGWLLIHHGVSESAAAGRDGRSGVRYAAGAMLLDAADPGRVLARTAEPLLEAELLEEKEGTVSDVVFPTATEEIDGQRFVFYGMADYSIGVARLDRVSPG